MMIKLNFKLNLPSALHTHNIGSSLHGVLMELLPTELVEQLHTLSYNPLRQRLRFEKDMVIWEIVGLHQLVVAPLSELATLKEIKLKGANQTLSLDLLTKEVIDLTQFVNDVMTRDAHQRVFTLQFTSPTTFKSQGHYDIFPDIRKLFRSLMMTFDFFSETHKVYDYEVLDYIEKNVHMTDYKLMTKKFYLEKIQIKGFQGQLTLKISGADQFAKLVYLMLLYATFSGIGAKTSLGMGGVLCYEGYRLH